MRKASRICIVMGLLLLAAALLLTAYNLFCDEKAGTAAEEALSLLEETGVENTAGARANISAEETAVPSGEDTAGQVTDTPDYVLDPTRDMPEQTINGNAYIGTIEIPSLSIKLPVMSEWSYPNLRLSPCRYTGSAYQDNLIILAHNYSRHFGNIKNLSSGDTVTFTDVDGNVFTYKVVELETLGSRAVDDLMSGDWDLTLFTCTIGGKYRVTVRCERG